MSRQAHGHEHRDGELEVRAVRPEDAGEVLTLQRAAFVDEAAIYDDARMPALVQTLDELRAELKANLGCVALEDGRLVGAARAQKDGDLLLVGRLAVAPDRQGDGIGRALLAALEQRGVDAGCIEAELFTGSLSEANIRLYEACGYREAQRIDQGDGTAQVFLRKSLSRPSRMP